jgi:hypothetical protein
MAHAQHEREKLLQAYFADALPLEVFKREQTRIAKEIDSVRRSFLLASSNEESLVGEAGHYLNPPGELRGGVLELIRTHRDRLEQCVRRCLG